ncbi:hypothetical protein GLOIN_2v1781203 [Rhizophagus clarus]|uniref:Uncharacterized protein n=1 Tax=Rhizophagus clarus TaxID=94130 RepID=A0A8H3QQX3_9GLOM|nr:hypothetical protein GLOIN_2v1781203 [Rhizophagus clarus]
MRAEFICQYISNEGNVCGRASTRKEGCKIHWKRRQRNSCKQCGKPTTSIHEKSALGNFQLSEAEAK